MRNPEFGNSFKLVLNPKIHRTMDGDLRQTQVPNTPQWQGFSVRFRALTADDLTTFIDWVMANRGQVITLTDYEDRTWTGVIVSKIIPITKGRSFNSWNGAQGKNIVLQCSYEVAFEFEGTPA